ncbi:LOW QUALITY PROTEIN: class I histocompatibility antigen, F10 alpha chain-like [Rhincodon typus]|uniref:LOW QUALITY PROTEIN: class I histocompatibility antigen, F10 alpha chain-like n=1 Tax=Rhincodon typus TaxID=259920 RepID=UPI002030DC3C|nr:LOW QUALITY PROTEIN: class I histocompatibility antigen, F10 alpha chain-like [Rhincodon typus]
MTHGIPQHSIHPISVKVPERTGTRFEMRPGHCSQTETSRWKIISHISPPRLLAEGTMIGLLVLGLLCGELSAETHSLRYFLTAMTPVSGFPQFVIVGYVDGVQFIKYDSDWKVLIPREQWMVESEGRKAWARKLYLAQLQELDFRAFVPRIMERINQTSGIYTYQMMTGCDLRGDVAMVGFNQYAWNGRDVLSFDREHMVWVSPVPWGESIKNRWDQDVLGNRQWKQYLEEECGTWLRKYLEYGQKELEVVAPIVSFTRLGDSNQLSCLITGFYPQAIEVTLWRDGVLIDETLSTGILPNYDRTYQIRKWIEFDPEDQAEYSCRVEHSGLEEKLVVIYDTKSHSQVFVTWIVLGVLGIIALAVGAVKIYGKKGGVKNNYSPTNSSDERTPSASSVNT